MSDSAGMYRFGDFEMEPGIAQLRQADSPVHVEPRTFDLLLYLIEHRARFVAKAELLDVVWEGVFVTESALTRAVTRLRQALGDTAHQSRYIETLRGRGYRFCAPIEIVSDEPTSAGRSASARIAVVEGHPIGAGPHNIAPAARDFTGRASELEELFTGIDDAEGASIAGLCGMGGIGKSELARQIAHARWSVYPDAHLEIDLGGASREPMSSATAIAQVLRDLNPQIELPDDPTLLGRLYRSSIFSLTIALLFSAAVFLFTGKSEANSAPTPCGPNAAVTTIFYGTAAQLEPVGGLVVPGCATKPGSVWGILVAVQRHDLWTEPGLRLKGRCAYQPQSPTLGQHLTEHG